MTASANLIDWDLAVATGARLVRPGPQVPRDEAAAAVAELRRSAAAAQRHVAEYAGLSAPADGASVAVIDRPGWVRANAAGFRTLMTPLIAKLAERRGQLPSAAVTAVGSRVTAVETGSLLAFLASKVLGQYELFPAGDAAPSPAAGLIYSSRDRSTGATGSAAAVADAPRGRLLLVAPNIVAAERELDVSPRDFRLWVCLHEETHRVQFGANPWLREHFVAEVEAFLDATDLDPAVVLRRLGAAAASVVDAVRGHGEGSLLDAVQTPAQREILDRLTALMSLLEGHADFVMDGVGPQVVPSVGEIRERFQRRRTDAGRPEQVLRRLLGIEAKMRQYRDGERFVRGVVDLVGMAGFNRVWTSPATLPSKAELADPAAWVARVHGRPGPTPLAASGLS